MSFSSFQDSSRKVKRTGIFIENNLLVFIAVLSIRLDHSGIQPMEDTNFILKFCETLERGNGNQGKRNLRVLDAERGNRGKIARSFWMTIVGGLMFVAERIKRRRVNRLYKHFGKWDNVIFHDKINSLQCDIN